MGALLAALIAAAAAIARAAGNTGPQLVAKPQERRRGPPCCISGPPGARLARRIPALRPGPAEADGARRRPCCWSASISPRDRQKAQEMLAVPVAVAPCGPARCGPTRTRCCGRWAAEVDGTYPRIRVRREGKLRRSFVGRVRSAALEAAIGRSRTLSAPAAPRDGHHLDEVAAQCRRAGVRSVPPACPAARCPAADPPRRREHAVASRPRPWRRLRLVGRRARRLAATLRSDQVVVRSRRASPGHLRGHGGHLDPLLVAALDHETQARCRGRSRTARPTWPGRASVHATTSAPSRPSHSSTPVEPRDGPAGASLRSRTDCLSCQIEEQHAAARARRGNAGEAAGARVFAVTTSLEEVARSMVE